MEQNSLIVLIIASIAFLGAIVFPGILLYLDRQRQRDRTLDLERQDEVAAKVDDVANIASEIAQRTAIASEETSYNLKQIHILVNDNLTVAKQQELTLARIALSAVQRWANPTPDDLALIVTMKVRIAELEAFLADRIGRQGLVDIDRRDKEK